jgi:hypothetical protein
MSKTIHMCLSVRGVLKWPARDLKRATTWIKKPDGGRFTVDELRDALLDELVQGHEVIPFGDCPTFDFKTGCPGHEQPELEERSE